MRFVVKITWSKAIFINVYQTDLFLKFTISRYRVLNVTEFFAKFFRATKMHSRAHMLLEKQLFKITKEELPWVRNKSTRSTRTRMFFCASNYHSRSLHLMSRKIVFYLGLKFWTTGKASKCVTSNATWFKSDVKMTVVTKKQDLHKLCCLYDFVIYFSS